MLATTSGPDRGKVWERSRVAMHASPSGQRAGVGLLDLRRQIRGESFATKRLRGANLALVFGGAGRAKKRASPRRAAAPEKKKKKEREKERECERARVPVCLCVCVSVCLRLWVVVSCCYYCPRAPNLLPFTCARTKPCSSRVCCRSRDPFSGPLSCCSSLYRRLSCLVLSGPRLVVLSLPTLRPELVPALHLPCPVVPSFLSFPWCYYRHAFPRKSLNPRPCPCP